MANAQSRNTTRSADQQDPPVYRHGTKKARLVELLQHPDGVCIAKLALTLGWKPHTTRAALTGLRKDGHALEKLAPADGEKASRYRLAA